MNLHGIVSPLISAVNPSIICQIAHSTGSTTQADGKRVPTYGTPVPTPCQLQSLQFRDVTLMDGLNIQGDKAKIYISGAAAGVVRATRLGGDLVTMPDNTVWLVVVVLEKFPDWCSFGIVMQNGA